MIDSKSRTPIDPTLKATSPLRIFFFSDWRVADLELAEAMLLEACPVDLILYGGDDVDRFAPIEAPSWVVSALEKRSRRYRGSPDRRDLVEYASKLLRSRPIYEPASEEGIWTVERTLRLFRRADKHNWLAGIARHATHGVGAVIGNDCYPEDRYVLAADGVRDLHRSPGQINGWGIVGIEGSIVSPGQSQTSLVNDMGSVQFPDESVGPHLRNALAQLDTVPARAVVVSHTPPRGCLDVGIRFGLERLGSRSLASFIRKHQPAAVLCGHVHSQGGRAARIGSTLVINCACDDVKERSVRAAVVELSPGQSPKVTWCDPKKHSIIYVPIGMGRGLAGNLESEGIRNRSDLFESDEATLRRAGLGDGRLARLRAYREGIHKRTHVWLQSRQLELPERFLFYDVETGLGLDLEARKPWLVGALIEHKRQLRQWAAPLDGKRAMLREFIKFVRSHPGSTLCSWSGNRFDDRALEEGLDAWYPAGLSFWHKLPKLDLLSLVRGHLVLPIDDWKLDSVAAYCGFQSDSTDTMDGFEAGLRYECFRNLNERLPVRRIRQRNANDVRRLACVAMWLRGQNQSLTRSDTVRDRHVPTRATRSSAPRETWGRAFARGVIRAFLEGEGNAKWLEACLARSNVPRSEIEHMMKALMRQRH